MNTYLFTSEAVSGGHPDKVADQISDAVLDAYLTGDKNSRVAAEVLVTTDTVILAGEYRSTATVDIEKTIRDTIKNIGYTGGNNEGFDAETATITNLMHAQSAEIAQGVDAGDRDSEGAGDQGHMFGYACDETPELMPAALHYAHDVLHHLDAKRRAEPACGLMPDAKSQVTLEYRDGKPVRAHTLLVSHQHAASLTKDALTALVKDAWHAVLPQGWIDADTRFLINPTGSFVLGGPSGDTGLTGRKIIVDTYGGAARHGGGAFSGKDPTKVDRSAAYTARYLAKNIVAAKLAARCEIQLAYAIGIAEPLALYVDTFGTAAHGATDEKLAAALQDILKLTPRSMQDHLGLAAPIYTPTATGGHFGRAAGSAGAGTFPWEKTDLVA
ncbi:MAG: methionine adenosyltransferase, partial [Alphaproteobacteria bacterium CG_4_10_14_0_8_um_filter_53_9]